MAGALALGQVPRKHSTWFQEGVVSPSCQRPPMAYSLFWAQLIGELTLKLREESTVEGRRLIVGKLQRAETLVRGGDGLTTAMAQG